MDKLYIKDHILQETELSPLESYICNTFGLYNISIHRIFNRVVFVCEVGSEEALFEQDPLKLSQIYKVMELRVRYTNTSFSKNILGTILSACKSFRRDLMFKLYHG